jgi:hypothetical protein
MVKRGFGEKWGTGLVRGAAFFDENRFDGGRFPWEGARARSAKKQDVRRG